jgi:hypothetical protein
MLCLEVKVQSLGFLKAQVSKCFFCMHYLIIFVESKWHPKLKPPTNFKLHNYFDKIVTKFSDITPLLQEVKSSA